MFTLFHPLSAQEKTNEQKGKELQLQQSIDQLKREMADQKQAMQDSIQNASEAMKSLNNQENYRSRGRGNRNPVNDFDPFMNGRRDDFQARFGREGESERTSWDISKQVNKSTFSKGYRIDVDQSSKSVVILVVGDCKSGEIKVSILMPEGKIYSETVIDASGTMNLRKSFSISDKENKDKIGEWEFKVRAKDATGFFRISIQTY
jgi:hypothetical protein